ncbi:MAG: hypothetical protein KA885_02160 [Spirochaetes bacterium]|nr:hypothetical protein [Spirochaetota bacterium]
MDFKQTLLLVINEMNNQKVDYGLIGGFALGLYGVDRSTSDLDFMINFKDIDKIKEILLENGFELLFFSDNVLQFVSPIKDFGEIDIIVAKREVSINMLKSAIEKNILGNSVSVKILLPEDIIGLKLQAIKNDSSRESIDRSDIKYLLENILLDINKIKNYAKILNMSDYFDKIFSELNNEKR